MKKFGRWLILILFFTTWLNSAKSQDSIAYYSFYQITSAWHLTPTDTLDISEKFNQKYYFAFFVEDISGNQFFTIKNYEGDETVCIGGINYDFTEEDGDNHVDFYSSDIYCDPEQETPAQSVMMELIPGSEIETGFKFYYLWIIFNDEEALLFLCFDATNIGEEMKEEEQESMDEG
jgi:hypothetical protein